MEKLWFKPLRSLALGGSIASYSVYPFVVGASHVLVERGYHLAVVELGELVHPGRDIPPPLENHIFDGLILHEGAWSSLSWRDKIDTPVIWWDSGIFAERNCLYRDEFSVGRALTEELLRRGHRRMCFEWTAKNQRQYLDAKQVARGHKMGERETWKATRRR